MMEVLTPKTDEVVEHFYALDIVHFKKPRSLSQLEFTAILKPHLTDTTDAIIAGDRELWADQTHRFGQTLAERGVPFVEGIDSGGFNEMPLAWTVVELSESAIRLSLGIPVKAVEAKEGTPTRLRLVKTISMQIKRRGIEMRMVLAGESASPRFDRSLVRAVARARRWCDQILSGQLASVGAIARNEHIAARYVRDLMPLAFLSPKTIDAIVEGRQPPELTIIALARRIDIPLLWSAQEQVLGLADSRLPQPPEIAETSSGGTTEIAAG